MADTLYSMATPRRLDVKQPVGKVSLTRQEFADECDINILMARYEKAGVFPAPQVAPQYLDLTDLPSDLMSYMDVMEQAELAFMSLPAVVRREFENDKVRFVEFAADPGNLDQMRAWGLAPPLAVKDSKPAEAGGSQVPPPAPASGGS